MSTGISTIAHSVICHTNQPMTIKPWSRISFLLILSLLLFPMHVRAITERLDDSASPRNRVASQPALNGQASATDADEEQPSTVTLKFGRIDYRLATAKYVGKQARIYYVVPLAISGLRSPSGLKVEWRGNGLFNNGQARPGERSLVWAGTVRDAWMTEGLDLTMQLNLLEVRLPSGVRFGFESYFEIETLP